MKRREACNFKVKPILAPVLCGLLLGVGFMGSTIAGDKPPGADDHILKVKSDSTLEEVLVRVLHSSKFVEQIASYNQLNDGRDSRLPIGSMIRIPKPYLRQMHAAEVLFVKGSVTHTQSQLVTNPPARGAKVLEGDTFTTGEDGFVSLSFHSGATVNLQPDSSVSVSDVDCLDETVKCVISLQANSGEITSEITPRSNNLPPIQFTVDSPFLSATVRGTAFYVNVSEGADRLGVTKGLVATTAGAQQLDLAKQKGVKAEAGQTPATVTLLPAPAITPATNRLVSDEDKLYWQRLSGAEGYRVVITGDEQSTPLLSEQVADASFAIPSLEVGQYSMVVTGIDNDKFLGLSAAGSFSYVNVEEDQSTELEVVRIGNRIDLTVPGYTGQVEMVISADLHGAPIERQIIDYSGVHSFDIDADENRILRVRKILGNDSVSRYSNFFVLEASE